MLSINCPLINDVVERSVARISLLDNTPMLGEIDDRSLHIIVCLIFLLWIESHAAESN